MRIMDWSSDVCSSDLAAIAGVLSFPLHANAQDTNPAPGTPVTDLTKVTVSASNSRLPDSDAARPHTLTVITAEELREQQHGRAERRERGCQYVKIQAVGATLKKKTDTIIQQKT